MSDDAKTARDRARWEAHQRTKRALQTWTSDPVLAVLDDPMLRPPARFGDATAAQIGTQELNR